MLDRTSEPSIEEIASPKIPKAAQLTLDGGYPLHLIHQGTQPVLVLEIELPVGRWNEPSPGLTYFVAKMITEGTGKKTAEEIAETFDFYGSHLDITPTLDAVQVRLYTLKKYFPVLVNLLSELLSESTFPDREFETLKNIRIQQIRQQHAKNNAFAGLKFREMLFGPRHPYGQVINEENARQMQPDKVRSFYPSLLSSPTFYLAGMIDEEDIELLQATFKGVNFGNIEEDQAHEIRTTSGVAEIVREASTQASLRQGHLSISRKHPDTHKLKVTNMLFGGFFGSRLMKNIREEKGLTYGIHSAITHLQKASYWHISTEVLKDKLDLSKREILSEIDRLHTTPPSAGELKMVTNYLKGKLLTSFDTPFNTLNMIKTLNSGGIDVQYYHDFLETLETITPGEVSETARTHFRPENMVHLSVS